MAVLLKHTARTVEIASRRQLRTDAAEQSIASTSYRVRAPSPVWVMGLTRSSSRRSPAIIRLDTSCSGKRTHENARCPSARLPGDGQITIRARGASRRATQGAVAAHATRKRSRDTPCRRNTILLSGSRCDHVGAMCAIPVLPSMPTPVLSGRCFATRGGTRAELCNVESIRG